MSTGRWGEWLQSAAKTATGKGLDILEGLGKTTVSALTEGGGEGGRGGGGGGVARQSTPSLGGEGSKERRRLRLGRDLKRGLDLVAAGVGVASNITKTVTSGVSAGVGGGSGKSASRSSLSARLREAATVSGTPGEGKGRGNPGDGKGRGLAAQGDAWRAVFEAGGGSAVYATLSEQGVCAAGGVVEVVGAFTVEQKAKYGLLVDALDDAVYADDSVLDGHGVLLQLSLSEWVSMGVSHAMSEVLWAGEMAAAEAVLSRLPTPSRIDDAKEMADVVSAAVVLFETLAHVLAAPVEGMDLASFAAESGAVLARCLEWIVAKSSASPSAVALLNDAALSIDPVLRLALATRV